MFASYGSITYYLVLKGEETSISKKEITLLVGPGGLFKVPILRVDVVWSLRGKRKVLVTRYGTKKT